MILENGNTFILMINDLGILPGSNILSGAQVTALQNGGALDARLKADKNLKVLSEKSVTTEVVDVPTQYDDGTVNTLATLKPKEALRAVEALLDRKTILKLLEVELRPVVVKALKAQLELLNKDDVDESQA
jgi:hypothetical protein